MATANDREFRIAPGQAPMARNLQALMTADNELKCFVYRGVYQLADTGQREALLGLLNGEFDTTITLPPIPPPRRARKNSTLPKEEQIGSLIAYLIVFDGNPVILYDEDDVTAAVFGLVLGKLGVDAARRVSFRTGMLPPAEVPAS